MHNFTNTETIKQKIIHINTKCNLFSILSLKYQPKIWKMQVLGDVTLCHWASSSARFEGLKCWHNNRNYSPDDITFHKNYICKCSSCEMCYCSNISMKTSNRTKKDSIKGSCTYMQISSITGLNRGFILLMIFARICCRYVGFWF